jgi:ectoine hydroxylase-related dioxygenase (phytanoyl-CoA dioxygenase family)
MSVTTIEATTPAAVSTEERQAFVRDGFLVKEGLISSTELDELKGEILKIVRGGYPDSGIEPVPAERSDAEALAEHLCLHQPHYVSPVIERWVGHPALTAVLGQITAAHLPEGWWDGSVKCIQSMYFLKSPGKPGQAWHQDEIYIPTRDRSLIGAWIAVDDATIDNGCLWVLPGSHQAGVLYPQRDPAPGEFDGSQEAYGFDDAAEVAVEVPAGSVVFFNGYLLHRSRKNRSDGYRRVLVNHYMSGQTLSPWGAQSEGATAGALDNRCIVPVVGTDPYHWKPVIPGGSLFSRGH